MNNSKQSLSNLQKSYDDSHYTSKNNFYSSQNAGFRFPEEELKEELDEDDEYIPAAFNKQISWQKEVSKEMSFQQDLEQS